MSEPLVGAVAFAILFGAMGIGIPIAYAFGLAGLVGSALLVGPVAALASLGSQAWSHTNSYTLMSLPLFVMMGEFVAVSGIGAELYGLFNKWLGRYRGGLALSTIGTCATFSAASGSSLACAVAVGSVAYPEMKKYGYSPRLATGSIAAGGTLDILIPPSTIFVIYSALTEVSLGKIIIAGIVPGILLSLAFLVTVAVWCWRDPDAGPRSSAATWAERLAALPAGIPVIVIFAFVIGGILLGWFSATEAAGVGAAATFVLALARGHLTWPKFVVILKETARICAMVFLIIVLANYFGYVLALSQLPRLLSEFIIGLGVSPMLTMALMLLVYVPLGCVMEVVAMLTLTMPIFFPTVQALGFDPVWFGIMVTMMAELAQITPPVGLAVYAVKGVAQDVRLEDVFAGITPFVVADLVCMVLVFAFPAIALFLPALMR